MNKTHRGCDPTRRMLLAGLAVSPLFGLWGCLGKAGLPEQYLRVLGPVEGCTEPKQGNDLPVVGVRGFKALDALDRLAVLVADGNVMQASQAWYWEAAPGRLLEQAVVAAMACSGAVTPAWPLRATTNTDATLSGMVTNFSVQTRGMTFILEAQAQLTAANGAALSAKTFGASADLPALTATSVADAATSALRQAARAVAAWAAESIQKTPGMHGGRK